MNKPRHVLAVAAVLEWGAGTALLLAPRMMIALLLGAEPHNDGLTVGRLAGVALLAVGNSCWGARADAGGPARTGTLMAITFYNAAAGLLLVAIVATGEAGSAAVWVTGVVHVALALSFAISLRVSR